MRRHLLTIGVLCVAGCADAVDESGDGRDDEADPGVAVEFGLNPAAWALAPAPAAALAALALDDFIGAPCADENAARVEGSDLEVSTAVCDPVVVEQPLPVSLRAGQNFFLYLAHDTLTPNVDESGALEEGATAVLALLIDGEPVWSTTKTLPSPATVVLDDGVVHDNHDEGSVVSFVVANHGRNSYQLLQVLFR